MADETLNIIIKQSSKGDGAKQSASGLEGIKKAASFAVAAFAALKSAQAAVDFVKFGAGVQRQANALDNLAKSAGTSGDAIVKSIQGASDFTIDRMTAMSSASKAMILDVAKTPEQFERLTKVATSLGRAMGQDAAKSIDDFVVAAGRQSRQIADNLGLMVSAETAQERYAQQLGKTAAELTEAENKQAFLNEMLVQGEAKMAALGKDSGDTAGQFEMLNASLADAKAALAEMAAETFEANVNLEGLAKTIREYPDRLREAQQAQVAFSESLGEAEAYLYGDADAIKRYSNEVDVFAIAADRGKEMNRRLAEAQAAQERETQKQRIAQARIPIVVRDTVASYDEYQARLGRMPRDQQATTKAIDEANRAFEEQERALKEAAEQALRTQEVVFGFSMSMKSHFEQAAQNAKDYTQRREEIEQEHQDNLAELAKRGQATLIRIDAEAEQAKLDDLKERLAISLQQQAEFTDKTKESTKMGKERQIADLQGQIATQEQLLDDYYNGRLIAHGENVSGLLAQENERYGEEMRLLEENRAAQEEAMNQSFGRMLLQQFDAWAQISGIGSQKAMDMRLAIAEEYGLIDEKARKSAEIWVGQWERFAESSKLSADDVVGAAQRIKDAVESIPTERTIKIRVEGGVTKYESDGNVRYQSGGYVMTRQAVLVGERGPELAVLPTGTEIIPAGDTTQKIRRAAGYGGDFRSSRGMVSLPGPLRPAPDTYGGGLGLGGGQSVVINRTWNIYLSGSDMTPSELAREIKRTERMEGDRPEMGRMF